MFVPLIMAHRILDLNLLLHEVAAFLVFCLAASGGYVVNDILDLPSDKVHPTKSRRPLPSGRLSLKLAGVLAAVFLGTALILGFKLFSPLFSLLLVTYIFLTLAYSTALKRIALLDVIILASLYGLRILAGGVSVAVPISEWLLAFSLFFFFSLACAKRYAELSNLTVSEAAKVPGRGYFGSDILALQQFGTTSGLMSVLVLALYLNGAHVKTLYRTPQLLWFLCPLVMYWILRVWLVAARKELNEDPIVFAIRDRVSYLVLFFSLLLIYFSSVNVSTRILG